QQRDGRAIGFRPAPSGDGGCARLIAAWRRVIVASDAFSLRDDRNLAARFEDGEFDLVHSLEPIIAPRRLEYFLLGEACAPQSRAQDVAVLDDDGWNAFENPCPSRFPRDCGHAITRPCHSRDFTRM